MRDDFTQDVNVPWQLGLATFAQILTARANRRTAG